MFVHPTPHPPHPTLQPGVYFHFAIFPVVMKDGFKTFYLHFAKKILGVVQRSTWLNSLIYTVVGLFVTSK
jgi:hypothetical protein